MSERDFHKAVAAYLTYALPPGAVFLHVPNGERRDAKTGALLKVMGVRAGVPDLLLIWNGIAQWIELKAERGQLSVAQKAMHMTLERAGSPVYLARSLAEIEGILLGIGIVPRAKVAA